MKVVIIETIPANQEVLHKNKLKADKIHGFHATVEPQSFALPFGYVRIGRLKYTEMFKSMCNLVSYIKGRSQIVIIREEGAEEDI